MLGRTLTFPSLLIVLAIGLLGATQINAQRYSGRATAIRTTVGVPGVSPLTSTVNDTGELPPGGGSITLASTSTNIAGAALTAGTSSSSTSGGSGVSHSTASVQNVSFTVLGNTITAASVSTVTDCSCPAQTCTGRGVEIGLTVNGTGITVTGDANQTILLASPLGAIVGTLVINEQSGTDGTKTVTGLHAHVTDPITGISTDIVVSSAHSDIICVPLADDSFYSGRAYGVGSTVTTNILAGGQSNFAAIVDDTGPLPNTGGLIGPVMVAGATLPGLLTTGALSATTSGGFLVSDGTPVSNSSSSVQTLSATVAGFSITATLLTSQTHCECTFGGGPACTGGAVLTNLMIAAPIGGTVTGSINSNPNNTITLSVAGVAVATIITNQQIPPSPTGTGSITVNALHIITSSSVPGVSTSTTDTIIASSHSDLTCATIAPSAATVTVSGKVLSPDNRGVRNAIVTLTSPTGVKFSATTNTFGIFRIEEVPTGQSYTAQVRSKGYRFASQLVSVQDEITDLSFIAQD